MLIERPFAAAGLAVAMWGLALGGSGCVRRYSQPEPDQPHADVHVRVVHHAELGPGVDEIVTLNGEALSLEDASSGVREAVVRVRAEGSQYGFETEFYHNVQTQEWRTVYETERYQCGYSRTGPTYCSRQVPRQRLVTVTQRVSDGGCVSALDQAPLAGAVYLVQYEFMGVNQCRATCQRLVQSGDGSTGAIDCGQNEPVPPTPFPPSAGFVDGASTAGGDSGSGVIVAPQ